MDGYDLLIWGLPWYSVTLRSGSLRYVARYSLGPASNGSTTSYPVGLGLLSRWSAPLLIASPISQKKMYW